MLQQTCTICDQDLRDQSKHCFVSKAELCNNFDLSSQQWNFVSQQLDATQKIVPPVVPPPLPNNENENLLYVCQPCEGIMQKVTSLYNDLTSIQLQLSALKSSLVMKSFDPTTNSTLNPFREFMRMRFSPAVLLKDCKKSTKRKKSRKSKVKPKRKRVKIEEPETLPLSILNDDSQYENNTFNSLSIFDKYFDESMMEPEKIEPQLTVVKNEVEFPPDELGNQDDCRDDGDVLEYFPFESDPDNFNLPTNNNGDSDSDASCNEKIRKKKKPKPKKESKERKKRSKGPKKPEKYSEKSAEWRKKRSLRRRLLYKKKHEADRARREAEKEQREKGKKSLPKADVEPVEGQPQIFRYKQQWDFEEVNQYEFRCRVNDNSFNKLCEKSFNSWPNMKYHFHKHHDAEVFRCEACRRTWKSEPGRDNHKCTPVPFKGKIRTKEYPGGRILFDDKWEYYRLENGLGFKCSTCSCIKRIQRDINEHIKYRHADPARFVCEQCGSAFGNKKHLDQHMELHSDEVHVCEECGKQCKTKITLYLHKQTHFSWKCETCNESFRYKQALKLHVQKVHGTGEDEETVAHGPGGPRKSKINGLEPFVNCPNCLRQYANQLTLDDHLTRCRDPTILSCKYPGCPRNNVPFATYYAIRAHNNRHKMNMRREQEKKKQSEEQTTQNGQDEDTIDDFQL